MEENLFRSIPRVDELLDRGELKASALSQTLLRESVREELDIPIKYIGVGEQIDDLRPFDPVEFANALFQNTEDKDRNGQEEA